jgi:hypothetical protein
MSLLHGFTIMRNKQEIPTKIYLTTFRDRAKQYIAEYLSFKEKRYIKVLGYMKYIEEKQYPYYRFRQKFHLNKN